MKGSKPNTQSLNVVEGNVLINIQPHKKSSWSGNVEEISRSFYVPK